MIHIMIVIYVYIWLDVPYRYPCIPVYTYNKVSIQGKVVHPLSVSAVCLLPRDLFVGDKTKANVSLHECDALFIHIYIYIYIDTK